MATATLRARETIWRRDNYKCAYCGCELRFGNRSVDHVIPVGDGGKAVPQNLVAACFTCNRVKYNKRLEPEREAAILALIAATSATVIWSERLTRELDSVWRYADYGVRQKQRRGKMNTRHLDVADNQV